MLEIIKTFSLVCVLGVIGLGSTASYGYTTSCPDTAAPPMNNCSLPGLVPGSFPYFSNMVSVKYNGKKLEKKGYFDIKAKNYGGSVDSVLMVSPEDTYAIDKMKYKLFARVDGEGDATGTIRIKGKIGGQKFNVTADLDGPWNTSPDGTLWGFNTANIVCSKLINNLTKGCTTNEVVYLNLLGAIGPDTGLKKISTAGYAITSVPLPAAAWLFGSGLLGLIGVVRRSTRAA